MATADAITHTAADDDDPPPRRPYNDGIVDLLRIIQEEAESLSGIFGASHFKMNLNQYQVALYCVQQTTKCIWDLTTVAQAVVAPTEIGGDTEAA